MKSLKPVLYGETQNSQKLWAYFLSITRKDEFREKIEEIRIKCKIPINGFQKKGDIKNTPFGEGLWTKKVHKMLISEVEKLCHQYDLFPPDWATTFDSYIFYSKLVKPDLSSGELCTIWDFVEDPESSWSSKSLKDFNSFYPLGIRISPYASQRDILDYVKKHHKWIRIFQDKYKDENNKITSVRPVRFNKDKRNNYIYKYRHLSRKQIAEKLNTHMDISMDEGHIGKIISTETKRRKKV